MRAFVLMLTVVVTATCAAAADWPQFLGPQRDGVAADAKLAGAWPAGGPKLLWRRPMGVGFGGASISGGKVYVLDRVDDAQDVLRCLNLADGEEQWSFAYDAPGKLDHNGSRSTPTVDAKYVYTVGPFGHMHCVDKATHKPVWSKHLLSDFGGKRPNWGVSQSPALYKDAVIVAPLGARAGVVAFEKATGTPLWQSPPLGELAYVSPLVTAIEGVDQVVVIANARAQRRRTTRVASVGAGDGKVLWTYDDYRCQIPIPGPTVVGGGRLFLTGGYNAGSAMIQVRRSEGTFTVREVFRDPRLGSQLHNALLHQGHLYLNCNTNSRQDGLVCMDLEGNVKWKTAGEPNFERGNLILAGGVILMLDGRSGLLRMVKPDPAGYSQVAEVKALGGREIWAPMALADGKLVLRDQHQMKCLEVGAKP